MNKKIKKINRTARHRRVRSKIFGTASRPRVSVFKSNSNVFIQLIDDTAGKTLMSSKAVPGAKTKDKSNKTEIAGKMAEALAKKAKEAGVTEVVFDRGGFKFHGRIKAVAEGLRAGGLKV